MLVCRNALSAWPVVLLARSRPLQIQAALIGLHVNDVLQPNRLIYHLVEKAILSIFVHSKAIFLGVATPAEPRGEKKLFLVEILGGEKLLKSVEKCRWNIFKRPERGYKFFKRVSDRFSDPFSRFSNRFSYRFKSFSGAVSFCKHMPP